MTEEQWLTDDDPERWIYPERIQELSERKLRLFCAACCRRIWSLLNNDCRSAVETAEGYADGREVRAALLQAAESTRTIAGDLDSNAQDAADAAASAAEEDIRNYVFSVSVCAAKAVWAMGPERDAELAVQANLFRDIFENPFRPVAFSPAWRTDAVVALARQMYESRDFSAVPILADALLDAGCDNDDILTHCRNPQQVHVRGCWVTDLVLGKN